MTARRAMRLSSSVSRAIDGAGAPLVAVAEERRQRQARRERPDDQMDHLQDVGLGIDVGAHRAAACALAIDSTMTPSHGATCFDKQLAHLYRTVERLAQEQPRAIGIGGEELDGARRGWRRSDLRAPPRATGAARSRSSATRGARARCGAAPPSTGSDRATTAWPLRRRRRSAGSRCRRRLGRRTAGSLPRGSWRYVHGFRCLPVGHLLSTKW